MTFKKIMRWDRNQRKLRIGAFIWQRGEWGMKTADGRCIPYSFKLTVALRPALFSLHRTWDEVRCTLLGVSLNYHRSAGGRFA